MAFIVSASSGTLHGSPSIPGPLSTRIVQGSPIVLNSSLRHATSARRSAVIASRSSGLRLASAINSCRLVTGQVQSGHQHQRH
jgi:hypothetical protein